MYSLRKALLASTVGLAAFVGLNALAACLLGPRDEGDVTARVAYFDKHKDEFDAVFIGSSRVCWQISPQVFDRRVQEVAGQEIRSFNLGSPSMFLPESRAVVLHVVNSQAKRLHWLFLELDDPKIRLDEHAGLMQRELAWHGVMATALTCESALEDRALRFRDRLHVVLRQLDLFTRNVCQVGRGQEIIVARMTLPSVVDANALLGTARDGYVPRRGTLSDPVDVREYQRSVSALVQAEGIPGHSTKEAKWFPQQLGPLAKWNLVGMSQTMRAAGIVPVFVIAPGLTAEEGFRSLSSHDGNPLVLSFNDPIHHPELYELKARGDGIHLSASGSELFSAELAERFATTTLQAR